MKEKNFDASWYVDNYPDVKKSGMHPEEHYRKHGRFEGRFAHAPNAADYLAVFPWRLLTSGRGALRSIYLRSLRLVCRVDEKFYLQTYPDVASSGIPPRDHYFYFGRAEGRLRCAPGLRAKLIARTRGLLHTVVYLARNEGGWMAATKRLFNVFTEGGYTGLKKFVISTFQLSNHNQINYADWIKQNELQAEDYERAEKELAALPAQPTISIIMPTYNSNLNWLNEAIESVRAQPYKNWELCIADDASPNQNIAPFLKEWSEKDSRIKFVLREKNGHISEASNSAIALATGEWLALFDHDDLLHPFAFYWVLKEINRSPQAQLIYSDEDKIDESGERTDPYFKSAWNYDLFLSQNCFSHLGLIRHDLANAIGGFRKGYEGSQDHDLILRAIEKVDQNNIIHIPKVLYHWRVHAESTAKASASKPYAAIAGEKSINDHLQRMGINAKASYEKHGYRVKYSVQEPKPLISLIIPTRNGLALLKQCIESITKKTLYKNYEFIVVDNGSDDPEILAYFKLLAKRNDCRVIRDERPFNYSQLNNLAAREAKGDVIGLINNDIEVISPEWLDEMVSHAMRSNVGAVGAKLLFPNNSLQHGGVILGVGGVANHAHLNFPAQHPGYFGRMKLIQQFSAVTAACLLVRREVYEKAGGLDESNLAVAFNDVDFCIRVKDLGYKNVWTPYALLYHHESATRGKDIAPEKRARFVREVNYMMNTWNSKFIDDPAYNPNLNIDCPDFSLSRNNRLGKWDLEITATGENG